MHSKKTQKSQVTKSEEAVAAVVAAATKNGVRRFVFAYFEPDQAGGGTMATVRMNEIKPREAMSLGLMAFEQAVELERRNSPQAPTEFHQIMETMLTEVALAQKKANDALMALGARMKK